MLGVLVDIILPSGSTAKYIKNIFAIFVVAVILTPIINLVNLKTNVELNYNDIELNKNLIAFIYRAKVENLENKIENRLFSNGFEGIDIKIDFSIENDEINYNFVTANLKNLVISSDKEHINKYEYIKEVIQEYTQIVEIVIDEWQRSKTKI